MAAGEVAIPFEFLVGLAGGRGVGHPVVAIHNDVFFFFFFIIYSFSVLLNAGSPLGEAARIVLELPKAREACPHNLAPTTSR